MAGWPLEADVVRAGGEVVRGILSSTETISSNGRSYEALGHRPSCLAGEVEIFLRGLV